MYYSYNVNKTLSKILHFDHEDTWLYMYCPGPGTCHVPQNHGHGSELDDLLIFWRISDILGWLELLEKAENGLTVLVVVSIHQYGRNSKLKYVFLCQDNNGRFYFYVGLKEAQFFF